MSKHQLPIVGVVMPCHNHEKFVVRAIQSIANQDYPYKFVTVIDDGSTDESYNTILSSISKIVAPPTKFLDIEDKPVDTSDIVCGMFEDMFLLVMKNEKPTGPSAARNKIIKTIWNQAHFFNPLDADDYHFSDKISKTVSVMLPDIKNIGLVYNDVFINDIENNTFLHEFRTSYTRELLENENIISNSPLLNKIALAKAGLYDETLRTCEDWDLWLRITENFVAVHVPEPLQVYTVTGQNATFSVNKDRWQKDWQTVKSKNVKKA